MTELAISIPLEEKQLMGILHQADEQSDTAMVLVVGGPQYRVGSHRQFVQLARYLYQHQINVLRFDYSGMGDSQGDKKEFDNVCDDIKAAIDSLQQQLPHVKKIILWGLCDAASAIQIYASQDDRVIAQVLLNPWLKSTTAQGKTMVKHYYLQRLMSKAFWKKLMTGGVNIKGGISEASSHVSQSMKTEQAAQGSYQDRMLKGAKAFKGNTCLILSGNDLTAKEFEQNASMNKEWQQYLAASCQIFRIADADHTFSTRQYKSEVEQITLDFIKQLA
ncbi:hydrolase 1, exosortase A system-associated [Flocculibacter collagenilyticus]|uniref:hydrolase 1, exosortase A system-associated n=1 Tax=Flocculibacter collagenilyticus TaxID=2744479 RepID=UPI0018F53B03|nr:hydrolase 1, exosortase A system-associated [Flocculibacter collagenilyticus]